MTLIPADQSLVQSIELLLERPVYFRDVLSAHDDWPYRAILRAWSDVRTKHELRRDDYGRYWREPE